MKTLLFSVWSIVFCANCFGQQNLYSFISFDTTNFNNEQSARWTRIHSNEAYTSFYFIEMTDFIRDTLYDGILTTPLPDSSSLTFNFRDVIDNQGSLIWYGNNGKIEDTVYQWSNLLYIDDESGKFGIFQTETAAYEMIDLSNDLQVLAVVDTTENFHGCWMTDSLEFDPLQGGQIIEREGSPCQIQVYVTYVEEAAEKVASIAQKAKVDILLANIILKNSAVLPMQGEFTYIGNSVLTEFVFDEFDIAEDKVELKYSDELETIRNNYEADIIVVYVPRSWYDGFPILGVAGGIGVASNPQLDESDAWVGVNIGFSTFLSIVPHELAHIIGSRHQWADDIDGDGYEHAFRFPAWVRNPYSNTYNPYIRRYVQTTMWNVGLRSNIWHFSNPDVEFLGDPTGTSTENNARKIQEEGCPTSNIINTEYPLTVYINGPMAVQYQSYNLFTAIPHGGATPYTYSWSISFNGINYQSLNETDDDVVITANYTIGTIFILKVEIEDDENNTAYGYLAVKVVNGVTGFAAQPLGSIISFVPNPNSGIFAINFLLNEDSSNEVFVNLFGPNGSLTSRKNLGLLKTGKHSFNLDGQALPSGLFFASITSGDRLIHAKQGVKMKK